MHLGLYSGKTGMVIHNKIFKTFNPIQDACTSFAQGLLLTHVEMRRKLCGSQLSLQYSPIWHRNYIDMVISTNCLYIKQSSQLQFHVEDNKLYCKWDMILH